MKLNGMFWTHDKGVVELWYPDGDLCATIQDNLGLGVSAEEVATLFVLAPDLLAVLKELIADIDYSSDKIPAGAIGNLQIQHAKSVIAKAKPKE